jgi:hypothetical protein
MPAEWQKHPSFPYYLFSKSIRSHTNLLQHPSYNMLQTGAKNQLGGLKLGLIRMDTIKIPARVTVPDITNPRQVTT